MRQIQQFVKDQKLRILLENLRMSRCTPEDIAFIETLYAVNELKPNRVNPVDFKHVFVITSLKAQRDLINNLSSKKFAKDSNQHLTNFYSINACSITDRSLQVRRRRRVPITRMKQEIL